MRTTTLDLGIGTQCIHAPCHGVQIVQKLHAVPRTSFTGLNSVVSLARFTNAAFQARVSYRGCAPKAIMDVNEAILQISEKLPGSMEDMEEAVSQLVSEFSKVATAAGVPEPAPGQEVAWTACALLAVMYAFAPPGGILGLIDYFLAGPVHQMMYKKFSPESVRLGRQLGEGSFGIAYEGFITNDKNGEEEHHVVLKRVKTRVEAANEMRDVELFMNHRLQRSSHSACVKFLGTMEVDSKAAHGKLHEGQWLVWQYEGDRTLAHLMKQRSFPGNLAPYLAPKLAEEGSRGSSKEEVQLREGLLVREAMKQILGCLKDLHNTGIVHRDLKPSNLVVTESENSGQSSSLKLIDLGACVDLRSGHNFVPNETVMDPKYAAPEKFVMPPKTTPKLPPEPISSLVSPFFWALNTPDRFDLYSAGIILMQLCVRQLRTDSGLESFNTDLSRNGHDLDKWRKKTRIPESEFALLDADDAAGWELAKALLQPRHDVNFVVWPGLGGSARPSATLALRFRFFHSKALQRQLSRIPATSAPEKAAKEASKKERERKKVPEPAPIPVLSSSASSSPPIGSSHHNPLPDLLWNVGSFVANAGERANHALTPGAASLAPSASSSDGAAKEEASGKAPPSSSWPRVAAPDWPMFHAPSPSVAQEVPEAVKPQKGRAEVEKVPEGSGTGGRAARVPLFGSFSEVSRVAANLVEKNMSSAAITLTLGVAAYEAYVLLKATSEFAHNMGNSAMKNGTLPLALVVTILGFVLLAEKPPPKEKKTKIVTIEGVSCSLDGERSDDGEEDVPMVFSRTRLVPKPVDASEVVNALNKMGTQVESLESLLHNSGFSSEQATLIHRVESLLLNPSTSKASSNGSLIH